MTALDTSAESMTRLLTMLGYPTQEMIEALMGQYGLTEVEAADIVARVKETHLSIEEL